MNGRLTGVTSQPAGVAQLVEQLIRNQQVVGSSPTAGSKHNQALTGSGDSVFGVVGGYGQERAVFVSELQIRDTSGIEAPSISRPTALVCLIDYGQVAETIFTASTCMWCSVASFFAVVPSALAASAAFIVVPVIVTLWPT